MNDEFKDTEIGRIPKEWEIKRLGDIVEYNLGRTPKRDVKKYWDEPYFNWVSISDLIQYGEIKHTKERISKIALDEVFHSKYSRKGTLIMSFKLVIGRVSILGLDAVHNEAIISIFPKYDVIDKIFLMYYLSIIPYDKYLDRAVKGNTLNKSKLDKLNIIIPPLEEQKRIAYVLSKIQNTIEIQDKLIKLLQELKKTMMHTLFTEGIGHTQFKDTEIGRIPKEWEIKTLKDISNIITGNTPSKANKEYWQNGKIEFIKPPDLKNEVIKTYSEMISYSAKSKARIIPRNSVLVSCIGIIGRVGYTNKEIAFNQQINGLILNDKIVYYLYVFYILQYEKKQFEILASKTTVPIINKSKFSTILIPLPPLEEQKKIAEILSAIDNKISIETKRKESFEKLFKTMLNKLMTGQIRTKNIEMIQ